MNVWIIAANPESDFTNHVKDFLTLIKEDTVLEAKRSDLRAKVIDRYAELEMKIDKIGAFLE
jgi:putative NADPH-quinone reductase